MKSNPFYLIQSDKIMCKLCFPLFFKTKSDLFSDFFLGDKKREEDKSALCNAVNAGKSTAKKQANYPYVQMKNTKWR